MNSTESISQSVDSIGSQLENVQNRLKLTEFGVELSHNLIELDQITLGSRARRIVHMMYRQNGHCLRDRALPTYRFCWHPQLPEDMELICVSPRTGHLKPGQIIPVLFTFTALGLPRFTEITMILDLHDENQENIYFAHLKAWQNEYERQKVEFTITDKHQSGINPRKNNDSDCSHGPTREFMADSRLEKLHPSSEDLDLEAFCQKYPKPTRPLPTLQHLVITAQLMNDKEMQMHGIRNWNYQFVDSTLFLHPTHSTIKAIYSKSTVTDMPKSHQIICTDLLTALLGDLLNTSDFVETLKQAVVSSQWQPSLEPNSTVLDDPVPFWSQISTKPNPPSSSLSSTSLASLANRTEPLTISQPDGTISSLEDPQNLVSKEYKSDGTTLLSDMTSASGAVGRKEMSIDLTEEDYHYTTCMQSLAFQSIVEDALSGMIYNIVAEANQKEFDLTSRLRVIALPPREQIQALCSD